MKGLTLLVAFACALPCQARCQPTATNRAPLETIVENVTIINVESGRRIPQQTVVIRGTRIVAIGGPIRPPVGALVVDGRSLFMIPGLWDMHTHVLEPQDLRAPVSFPLLIANGITGIRNMHSDAPLSALRTLRRRVTSGDVIGPRVIISSPMLDGPSPMWPAAIAVSDATRARVLVDSLVAAGADLIKVYSYLPRDIYLAIAARSRERGVPFAGHVPFGDISVREASLAGQASIEHLEGVIEACSIDERELRTQWKRIESVRGSSANDSARFKATWAMTRHAANTYAAARCSPTLQTFVEQRTWQTPTLSALQVVARADDESYQRDSNLRYFPGLRAERAMIAKMLAPAIGDAKTTELGARRIVREMQRRGVGLLAGSDAPSGGILPGFSLHDELEALVQAGLTPIEALRTATLNPARYLGATDSLGTIAAGKVADLVLLDADPLLDIRNTRRVRGVFVNGRYVGRRALDAMNSLGGPNSK